MGKLIGKSSYVGSSPGGAETKLGVEGKEYDRRLVVRRVPTWVL